MYGLNDVRVTAPSEWSTYVGRTVLVQRVHPETGYDRVVYVKDEEVREIRVLSVFGGDIGDEDVYVQYTDPHTGEIGWLYVRNSWTIVGDLDVEELIE